MCICLCAWMRMCVICDVYVHVCVICGAYMWSVWYVKFVFICVSEGMCMTWYKCGGQGTPLVSVLTVCRVWGRVSCLLLFIPSELAHKTPVILQSPHPILPRKYWDYKQSPLYLTLSGFWSSELKSSWFDGKCFTRRAITPASICSFKNKDLKSQCLGGRRKRIWV